jgi:hypothetical protein
MKRLKLSLGLALAVALSPPVLAQFTITDIGSTAPTPGPNDVSLIYTNVSTYGASQNNDGLNYWWDNGTKSPSFNGTGQTFTTGPNAAGYTITNLAVKTGGAGGSGELNSQTFTLRIFSIDGSSTATLITNIAVTGKLNTEGDWLQFNGLGVQLTNNGLYGYTLTGNTGYEQLANNGNNPYAGGEICYIPNSGGTVTYGSSHVSDALFNVGLTLGSASAGTVTVTDIGSGRPTPGINDLPIAGSGAPSIITYHPIYGLNYYWDSNPGQTFTTPASSFPWLMTNLVFELGYDSGSSPFASQNFTLRIFSVSSDGTTATNIYAGSYTTSVSANGDWVQCSDMNVVLQPNKQYGYTFSRGNGSYEEMGAYDGNHYSGGKICLIPASGGTVSYGTQGSGSSSADAAFDVGLSAPLVTALAPTASPSDATIYAGTLVTLNEVAIGQPTITLQWQAYDFVNGIYTNIPGATSSNLVVNTTGLDVYGSVPYQVIATTTASGGVSSTNLITLNITSASAPQLVNDTTPSPNTATNYQGLSQTFSTAFVGTQPIRYQWYVATDGSGTGATPITAATNATLMLNNLQLSDTGYYSVTATNTVSPYTATSSWAQLTVLSSNAMLIHWQAPVSFNGLTAGQILTNTTPGKFFEAACASSTNIPVTVNGLTYTFSSFGTAITVSNINAFPHTGAFGANTTGNPSLDTVLDTFDADGILGVTNVFITLNGLTVGSNYCVQLYVLDDRGPGLTRSISFQDPANVADSSTSYLEADNKYVVGTFTAPSTNITIQENFLAGVGNLNAVILGTVGWVPSSVNIDPVTANFKVVPTGQTLHFTWAADHQGWQLYTNAVGLTATSNWYPVSGSANGTNQDIMVNPQKPNVFFQLRYP